MTSIKTAKYTLFATIFALIISLFAGIGSVSYAAEADILYGDADGNGKFELSDITATLNYYVNGARLEARILKALDVDGSGGLTLNDVSALLNKFVGNIDRFPVEEVPNSSKTLVVYFSATGSTKRAAEYVAQKTGADIFELIPTRPYRSADLDWTNRNSRVSREHDDPALRDMELEEITVQNWSSYDTVFIGYPIWWGIAAWAVDPFVKANDFSGKTVIPFCTSSSSGLGESGKLLADETGTGNWLEGRRFSSSVSESDISEWIDELGIAA